MRLGIDSKMRDAQQTICAMSHGARIYHPVAQLLHEGVRLTLGRHNVAELQSSVMPIEGTSAGIRLLHL